jgi:ketosteroid isomerase-like protein
MEEWLARYRRAWEEADAEAVAALFTPDASYRSHIFGAAHEGAEGILAYWGRATATQSDVAVRFGRPLVDGARVAVEWWTTMGGDEGDLTLVGILLLRMTDGGRCASLREYWHTADGRRAPYDGWGEPREGPTEATRARAARWARAYCEGWSASDVDAIVGLYAEDVVYRSHPFRPPQVGRAGVRDYTATAFGQESSIGARFGAPVVSAGSAAVEYWTTMAEGGAEVTLAGCTILGFAADGLVASSREYWHVDAGWRRPPPEWGT